jgi:hypothetical protein
MILGLHSLLFPTKVKAATAIISSNQALDSLIRYRSPTKSAGRPDHQLSEVYGNYTTSDRVFGTIVTTQPVTPHSGLVDVTSTLVSFNFTDDVQQAFNETNTHVWGMQLETNNNGEVIAAYISLWKLPITTQNGGQVHAIDVVLNIDSVYAAGMQDLVCNDNSGPGGQCVGAIPDNTNSGFYFNFNLIFRNGFD